MTRESTGLTDGIVRKNRLSHPAVAVGASICDAGGLGSSATAASSVTTNLCCYAPAEQRRSFLAIDQARAQHGMLSEATPKKDPFFSSPVC